MLRALGIAVLLIAAVLGGYLYWHQRTRARYNARSLSAAPTRRDLPLGRQPQTRTLHVPGCAKDFTVNVGELVQPQITPALSRAALDQATAIYGKPTQSLNNGTLVWQQEAFTLIEAHPGKPDSSLQLTMQTGHVVQTLDDIELGIDSFNAILIKMRNRNLPVEKKLTHGNDSWTFTVTVPSGCGPAWQSQYARTLPETPELDRETAPRITNGVLGQPQPNAFLNKLTTEYTLTRLNPAQPNHQ